MKERHALGVTMIKLGDTYATTGDRRRALDQYRRALRLYEELQSLMPREPKVKRNLATSHLRIGDTLGNPDFPNLGDQRGAREHYEKNLALTRELYESASATWEDRVAFLSALSRIGDLERASGDHKQALALYPRGCIRRGTVLDRRSRTTARTPYTSGDAGASRRHAR